MNRSTMLRASAGAALVAGTFAVVPAPGRRAVHPAPHDHEKNAVEGTPGDTEYDFLVDCEGESTGVEFTLTDGESITLEDIDDLGVLFADGIECVILEREGEDPPDEVEADGVIVSQDPAGAPAGRGRRHGPAHDHRGDAAGRVRRVSSS